ncbi:MAG: glycosyltransferase family 2 protein [Candidatus Bathyarchaeota archaeon]
MISVIIPVYNEEENILPLYKRLTAALENVGNYEIIFVDDGSTDRTFKKLSECSNIDSRVKIAKFRRNFGQSAAISYGFDNAQGDIMITMDADLQLDPNDIPGMIKQIQNGSDVVCGWRKQRKDPYFRKKLPSRFFNWLTSKVTGLKIHDIGTPMRAYRAEVVKNISGNLYGELHRYVPVLAAWKGYKISEMEVKHNPRKHGKSKYGSSRLIRGFFDLISVYFLEKYLSRPLHLFGTLGLLSLGLGFVISIYLGFLRIFYLEPLSDKPLFTLGILMIVFGTQFITLGLLGEMITRFQHENRRTKSYEVETLINFDKELSTVKISK